MSEEERKERQRERDKRYYEAHKEAILAQKKEYYKANKEDVLARVTEYNAQHRERVKKEREARKLAAIARMGGCCADCKQTFHHSMYDFHHLNPTDKEHEPYRLFAQKDQDRIDNELAKCVLLCSNCQIPPLHRLNRKPQQ